MLAWSFFTTSLAIVLDAVMVCKRAGSVVGFNIPDGGFSRALCLFFSSVRRFALSLISRFFSSSSPSVIFSSFGTD